MAGWIGPCRRKSRCKDPDVTNSEPDLLKEEQGNPRAETEWGGVGRDSDQRCSQSMHQGTDNGKHHRPQQRIQIQNEKTSLWRVLVKKSESRSVMSDSLWPHGLYSPWKSPGQNTGVVAFPFFRGSSNPGIEPRAPTLQADSLPAEPPRKPLVREVRWYILRWKGPLWQQKRKTDWKGKRSTEPTQEPLEMMQVRAGGSPGENCNGGCDWWELVTVWVRTVMADVTGNALGRGEMIHSWMGYKDAKEEWSVSPEVFFVCLFF